MEPKRGAEADVEHLWGQRRPRRRFPDIRHGQTQHLPRLTFPCEEEYPMTSSKTKKCYTGGFMTSSTQPMHEVEAKQTIWILAPSLPSSIKVSRKEKASCWGWGRGATCRFLLASPRVCLRQISNYYRHLVWIDSVTLSFASSVQYYSVVRVSRVATKLVKKTFANILNLI